MGRYYGQVLTQELVIKLDELSFGKVYLTLFSPQQIPNLGYNASRTKRRLRIYYVFTSHKTKFSHVCNVIMKSKSFPYKILVIEQAGQDQVSLFEL